MNDSRKAEEIRDILRLHFEIAAQTASEPTRSALFGKLAATTANIPPAMIDAYSEVFDDLSGSEIQQEMMTTSLGSHGGRNRRAASLRNTSRSQPLGTKKLRLL